MTDTRSKALCAEISEVVGRAEDVLAQIDRFANAISVLGAHLRGACDDPAERAVWLSLTLPEYELLLAFVALGMVARDTILCPGDERQVEGLQRATLTTVKLIEALRARVDGGEEPLIGRIDRTALEAFGAELKLRLVKEEPKSPIIVASTADVVQLTNHRRRHQ